MPVNHEARRQAAAWLRPGKIALLTTPFTDHDKFVVVCAASAGTGLWGFFINSEINQYIIDRPALLACQIDCLLQDHRNFLNKDSSLDCAGVIDNLSLSGAIAQLAADGSRKKGELTVGERERVVAAIRKAPKISDAQRATILPGFGAQP